jgi:hypothetical protein
MSQSWIGLPKRGCVGHVLSASQRRTLLARLLLPVLAGRADPGLGVLVRQSGVEVGYAALERYLLFGLLGLLCWRKLGLMPINALTAYQCLR